MKNLIKLTSLFLVVLYSSLAFGASPKADKIKIEDDGDYYTSTEVEGALQEIGAGTVVPSPTWGNITGTLSDQTDLQTALDAKVDENSAIIGATKTKITYDSKGLVTSGEDATTADISDSTNARYVTDAQLVVIGNTSNTNTGDQSSSDFTHNDLGGLNDGTDYEHITQTQKDALHPAVTVTDSSEIDFTLSTQDLTADLITGSIDVLKLDSGVQDSLALADSALQTVAHTDLTDMPSAVNSDHDGRYYTETESDNNFVNITGDTMTGSLLVTSIGFILLEDGTFLLLEDGTNLLLEGGDGTITYASESITSSNGIIDFVGDNLTTSGTFTLSSLTQGSVPFVGVGGLISEDNAKLFWDDTNYRLGIGTATPTESLEVSGNIFMTSDSDKILFGAGKDASIFYGGTNLVFDSQEAGSGNFYFKNGSVGINIASPSSNAKLHVSNAGNTVDASLLSTEAIIFTGQNSSLGMAGLVAQSVSYNRPVFKGARARGTLASPSALQDNDQVLTFLGAGYDGTAMQGTAGVFFYVDGAVSRNVVPQRISFTTSETTGAARTEKFLIKADGNIQMPIDNQKLLFGAAQDASIYYDGTDLNINTKEVGSGTIKINGTSAVADGTYTVGLGTATNGTITVKAGIITAVQECTNT